MSPAEPVLRLLGPVTKMILNQCLAAVHHLQVPTHEAAFLDWRGSRGAICLLGKLTVHADRAGSGLQA
jgi:hypothetical protein